MSSSIDNISKLSLISSEYKQINLHFSKLLTYKQKHFKTIFSYIINSNKLNLDTNLVIDEYAIFKNFLIRNYKTAKPFIKYCKNIYVNSDSVKKDLLKLLNGIDVKI